MKPCGILNLDKPAGKTSRDIVNQVARLVKPAKAGHAGTLDPLATGVLVVCVGDATRLIEYVQQGRKHYTAEFQLGLESDTEDIEGQVHPLPHAPQPTLAELEQTALSFVGRIWQRPPAYSALKVAGQRAYALARAGETVELSPRQVDVFQIDILSYEFPRLTLHIECGSGVYVRSLGRDLAQSLGTCAVMSALRRTAVGPFSVSQATPPHQLTPDLWPSLLHPPLLAVEQLPRITLNEEQVQHAWQGKFLQLPQLSPTSEVAAVNEAGRLISLLAHREGTTWGPTKNFRS